MTRGRSKKDHNEPERRCIATGETQPKGGLVRFVIGPDDVVYPDVAEKLPGRGIWVAADRAAIDLAVKKGLFSRGAKRAVKAPETLTDDVEKALTRRVIDLLSLARKSGVAICGYEKVKTSLWNEEAEYLIQSSDGSERGKSKLRNPPGSGRFIGVLTSSELGLAFGRENVIHGALTAGGLTPRVVEEAQRLSGLRLKVGDNLVGKGTKTT